MLGLTYTRLGMAPHGKGKVLRKPVPIVAWTSVLLPPGHGEASEKGLPAPPPPGA